MTDDELMEAWKRGELVVVDDGRRDKAAPIRSARCGGAREDGVSTRCRLGWHDRGVSSHRLGQPWTFNMYCYRCGKRWTNTYWLPPQPITCDHPVEYHVELRPPMLVDTPVGPRYQRWMDCGVCRSLRQFNPT